MKKEYDLLEISEREYEDSLRRNSKIDSKSANISLIVSGLIGGVNLLKINFSYFLVLVNFSFFLSLLLLIHNYLPKEFKRISVKSIRDSKKSNKEIYDDIISNHISNIEDLGKLIRKKSERLKNAVILLVLGLASMFISTILK